MAKMEDLKVQVEISQPSLIRIKALQLSIEHNRDGLVGGRKPTAEWLIEYASKLEEYILEGKKS